MLDFSSLLLAAALSGTCLSITMLAIWFTAPRARFVLTVACGILVLVAHVVAFWRYTKDPDPWLCQAVLALLTLGFLVICLSAMQYLGFSDYRRAVVPTLAAMAACAIVTYLGFDGIGFQITYASVTVLLAAIGTMFWTKGDHDRRILLVVSFLSGACGASFALCCVVLVAKGQWVLGGAPDNWAERLNSVVAVACMTGLGALTLSLHHLQAQIELKAETMTDPLTGLMNRRALSELYGDRSFGPFMAIAMFDLDHFKMTNDVFGHPAGDQVLCRFAAVIKKYGKTGVDAFRLGGEEFALVMTRITPEKAHDLASRLGVAFGTEVVPTPRGPLRSSVSGGMGFGSATGRPLDEVLAQADAALYAAKRAGRNRVIAEVSADQPDAGPALKTA
ncbi:GGDEF domain-containing protein [Mesorhizobium sp. M2D.F.Ca.ET.185.01.1.1]|uniref:GGDEF domain-containing protein n=1 Tax=unclassified Mesorhizobium TaxID=325217 RepID=UPI000FCAC0FA|nr:MULTISPECIES: GGDEF domain-containing protein [unclassified Mesorhizobium]TGP79189.1 GGDEF domain-containing protein [bacterium M00.F.Ca.ET.227.01.1.1]TGQ01073.1 GGDEF domain-containing protein [bacterium M00.F.Ca.ET.221.01.1.1]TGQ02409.1 GGDEF domain-containing protein [bacterium M00.F.Ca.ET.222.01.1.1]TGU12306.1 GGDEF domain-containing protein [bacterium M00.F.Ca.ET.163.01.1.1]TGU34275.1 GGDEF domain-containing protein [bacterium M00.F.Ca.ET.156.01.1.1]TGU46238.1 GGDEF domain-containing 